MDLTVWARDLGRSLLAEPWPRRWAHSQGVAARAQSLAGILGDDVDLLWAAAMLHDIGYTPALATTGFHPLDGARTCAIAQQRMRDWCGWWPTTHVPCWRQRSAG